ncbi:MAG: ATP-dependent DNA ligase [Acidimicrobiales bacterium]|nr:ATP-dependent DNA ligase [Acidimicrobiales bacterium]
MDLPVLPPVAPMLARLARDLPEISGVAYEPKWDGFRTIVFRDGDEVELGSRNERPMTRYFPELLEPLRTSLPERCVLDGEIVIATAAGLDFDALLQRIHPAESRVRLLASTTPASFVAFDLLALDDTDWRRYPFGERRQALEQVLADARPPVHLTPATADRTVALGWFRRFEGAGLDGVMVKSLDQPYREGERVQLKVKHERTADCVVGGFRWHTSGRGVGSLLLGLHDDRGGLHHVGVTASFTAARRQELVDELAPYRMEDLAGHPWEAWASAGGAASGDEGPGEEAPRDLVRRPGTPSRWTGKRNLSWLPLRPELVCEVAYDHLQGDRFRHAATFRRWRPDRQPESCTYAQLEAVPPAELEELLGRRG